MSEAATIAKAALLEAVDEQDKPRFELVPVSDLMQKLMPREDLIDGWLPRSCFGQLFNASSVGKTFCATDMGCSIAAGIDWHGIPTRAGMVIYILGEGQHGFPKRIRAWCDHHGIDPAELQLYVSRHGAQFCNPDSACDVAFAVERICDRHVKDPALVVVDTLARNFGGNENSTEDMTAFVSNIDTFLRKQFNTATLTLHHPGHGDKERARGSYALQGALDAEYRLECDPGTELLRLSCTKMKDGPMPEPLAFSKRVQQLEWIDSNGNPETSLVLVPADCTQPAACTGLGKRQRQALDILQCMLDEKRANLEACGHNPEQARVELTELKDALDRAGILGKNVKQAWYRLRSDLLARGEILIVGVHVAPAR